MGGTWHVNRVEAARKGDVMWTFTAIKEGDSESMKRTIFCGAQEGPLAGDFLPGAPGLGCFPRERWCLLWGTCTLHGCSSEAHGAHSLLWTAGCPSLVRLGVIAFTFNCIHFRCLGEKGTLWSEELEKKRHGTCE